MKTLSTVLFGLSLLALAYASHAEYSVFSPSADRPIVDQSKVEMSYGPFIDPNGYS